MRACSFGGQKDLLGGSPHLSLRDERTSVADHLSGADQKNPRLNSQSYTQGKVKTVVESGVQFWLGNLGLTQVIPLWAC